MSSFPRARRTTVAKFCDPPFNAWDHSVAEGMLRLFKFPRPFQVSRPCVLYQLGASWGPAGPPDLVVL